MKPTEYLDKCKIALKVQSHYALAKELDLHSGLISDYYSGKRWPDLYACTKMALALGLDPMEVAADIEEQREKNEKRREFWRGFSSRIRRAAGPWLLVLCLLGSYGIGGSGNGGAAALASAILVVLGVRIMCIMSNPTTYRPNQKSRSWFCLVK